MTDDERGFFGMGKRPPRGLPQWEFHCPVCKRNGVMAFQYLVSGKPVPPEELTCPNCHVKVEILGRHDQ